MSFFENVVVKDWNDAVIGRKTDSVFTRPGNEHDWFCIFADFYP